MKNTVYILFSTVIIALPLSAQNGTPVDSTLREIESLYHAARYADAELEARRLRESVSVNDSIRLRIDQWIAFSLIAQGKPAAARERFITILSFDPEYDLDPVLTSPKIIAVLNDAKGAYRMQQRTARDSVQKNELISASSVTFRTVLFPGWEQLYRGKSTKGAIFLGAGITTLGAAITFEALRSDAREKYLAARIPADIASNYDTYDTYRKAGIYSIIAFAVVYIASEVDVFTEQSSGPIVLSSKSDHFGAASFTFSVPF
jgi:hypothetical protein